MQSGFAASSASSSLGQLANQNSLLQHHLSYVLTRMHDEASAVDAANAGRTVIRQFLNEATVDPSRGYRAPLFLDAAHTGRRVANPNESADGHHQSQRRHDSAHRKHAAAGRAPAAAVSQSVYLHRQYGGGGGQQRGVSEEEDDRASDDESLIDGDHHHDHQDRQQDRISGSSLPKTPRNPNRVNGLEAGLAPNSSSAKSAARHAHQTPATLRKSPARASSSHASGQTPLSSSRSKSARLSVPASSRRNETLQPQLEAIAQQQEVLNQLWQQLQGTMEEHDQTDEEDLQQQDLFQHDEVEDTSDNDELLDLEQEELDATSNSQRIYPQQQQQQQPTHAANTSQVLLDLVDSIEDLNLRVDKYASRQNRVAKAVKLLANNSNSAATPASGLRASAAAVATMPRGGNPTTPRVPPLLRFNQPASSNTSVLDTSFQPNQSTSSMLNSLLNTSQLLNTTDLGRVASLLPFADIDVYLADLSTTFLRQRVESTSANESLLRWLEQPAADALEVLSSSDSALGPSRRAKLFAQVQVYQEKLKIAGLLLRLTGNSITHSAANVTEAWLRQQALALEAFSTELTLGAALLRSE